MKVFYFAENINFAMWSSIVTSPMLNIWCTSLWLKVWPYHIKYIIRQLCKVTCITDKVWLFCLLAFPCKYYSCSHKLIAFCWFTFLYFIDRWWWYRAGLIFSPSMASVVGTSCLKTSYTPAVQSLFFPLVQLTLFYRRALKCWPLASKQFTPSEIISLQMIELLSWVINKACLKSFQFLQWMWIIIHCLFFC
jgi:hypothetical protein